MIHYEARPTDRFLIRTETNDDGAATFFVLVIARRPYNISLLLPDPRRSRTRRGL